jgi:hypothetical protein
VTLTIDRLVTRGKLPRQLKVDTALVEQVAREQFAVECARQLSRPWPVQPKVARIRRLRVRVTIPAAQFTPDTLAAAWTAAFIRELFAALAHSNGVEIVRFESRAEYLASAIRDLLTGVATQRWVYQEFERSLDLGTAGATFALFDRDSSEIVPTLLILDRWSLLDRLLAVWDAATLERIFLVIESTNGVQDEELSVEDLITVAGLLLGRRSLVSGLDSSRSINLGERNLALKLFLGLARESDWRNARVPSPLKISRALRILDALLDLHKSMAAARRQLQLAAYTLDDKSRTTISELLVKLGSIASSGTRQNLLNEFWNLIATASSGSRAVFAKLLGELTSVVSSETHRQQITEFWNIIAAGSGENRTALAALFEELMSVTGSGDGASRATEFRWITTECAGLFFLIRIVERLGWAARLGRCSFGAAYGPRFLTYTLAGLGSAILGRFDEAPAYLDPGLALFSGWVEAPDLGGLCRFFASESAQTRRDLLLELLGDEVPEDDSLDWRACFDSLANHLIREFAGRIRGFGRSSRSFIVKNFLALPGRIRVEETRLVIVFTSSPLNVVVHLSRLDDPVDAVTWLGGRRVEFQTDGEQDRL